MYVCFLLCQNYSLIMNNDFMVIVKWTLYIFMNTKCASIPETEYIYSDVFLEQREKKSY